MDSNDIRALVCSFKSLYKAFKKCKLGVSWKDSVANFIVHVLKRIFKLKQQLDTDTYKIDPYGKFTIHEPRDRDITSTTIKDRVFQQSFCENYFTDKISSSFIYDNAACQKNKGNEFARKRLVTHLQRYFRNHGAEGWCLKIDLHNYFASIDHEQVMDIASSKLNKWGTDVTKQIVDSFDEGLGLGSPVSQHLALAMLDGLDHVIKDKLRIKYYIRYNDDMVILSDSKEELDSVLETVKSWLKEHELQLNEKKTKIFPLSQGINFLGFRFRLTETGRVLMTVLPEKVKHERRKLRHLVARAKAGLMTKAQVDKCYDSWKSYVDNRHRKGASNTKAHRDTHNLVLSTDQFYKSLWEE